MELLLSSQILEEIREVMNRPELSAKYKSASELTTEKFLEGLAKKSRYYRSVPRHFAFARDPDDEPYINLSVEGNADYLVTRDSDLLDLMTNHDLESKQFRQKTRPLKIVDPVEFLKIFQKHANMRIQ
ncbi:MAG: putative toxin-antitoxin system toxin component, PIN family [Pyrinomonadaceae bacterium]